MARGTVVAIRLRPQPATVIFMEMENPPNRIQLIGYLSEALPHEEMVRIEERLRTDAKWRGALVELREELDLGEHSVATIWRRHRLTCPSRERLGALLAGGLVPDEEDYLRFHLDVIKCRWCAANLADLQTAADHHHPGDAEPSVRRKRLFQSSVGHLPTRARR